MREGLANRGAIVFPPEVEAAINQVNNNNRSLPMDVLNRSIPMQGHVCRLSMLERKLLLYHYRYPPSPTFLHQNKILLLVDLLIFVFIATIAH